MVMEKEKELGWWWWWVMREGSFFFTRQKAAADADADTDEDEGGKRERVLPCFFSISPVAMEGGEVRIIIS